MGNVHPEPQKEHPRYDVTIVPLPQLRHGHISRPLPWTKVKLAYLSKDCLSNIPKETKTKGLSVLSCDGIYFIVGTSDVAHAFGDHHVPLDVVVARYADGQAKLSPHPCFIHRLPTELLCAIFMMCGDPNNLFAYPRDEQGDWNRLNADDGHSFYIREIMIIECVCWRWFTISRGYPRLWTLVDVPLPQPCDVAALKLSLAYSKDLPLTLRICDNHYSQGSTYNSCSRFLTLVARNACRWREMSIVVIRKPDAAQRILSPLLDLPQDSFTSLERAFVHLGRDDALRPTTSRLWQMFYESPALRVSQVSNLPGLTFSVATLQKLTHFGLDSIHPRVIMSLLRSCPRLQVVQAVVQDPDITHPMDDAYLIPKVQLPILLPYLHTLILRGMSNWTNLFDGILAPNCRRLELLAYSVRAEPICDMLRRSGARLQMLALRWENWAYEAEIVELLLTQELVDLKIFCYAPFDGIDNRVHRFDFSFFLPPRVIVATHTYEEAEEAYRSLGY